MNKRFIALILLFSMMISIGQSGRYAFSSVIEESDETAVSTSYEEGKTLPEDEINILEDELSKDDILSGEDTAPEKNEEILKQNSIAESEKDVEDETEKNESPLKSQDPTEGISTDAFNALERDSFTKGLYRDGIYYTGRELRDYLFTLKIRSFILAVNQMDMNQAGSLNGIVDPVQGDLIERAIIHTGFETTDFVKTSSLRLFSFIAFTTEPIWPNPGAIYLEKKAESLGNNTWEMELLIRGKDFEAINDVVLVFDNSNNVGEQDLRAAKMAADRFGETLLTEGSLTRISIVRFAGDILDATPYYTYETLNDYKAYVDLISQQGGNGSNLQAGIHKGYEILGGSAPLNQKNMVILGSSNPTYSFPFAGIESTNTCTSNHKNNSEKQTNVSITDPLWPVPLLPDYTTIIGSGSQFTMQYNAFVDLTCQHNYTVRYPYGNFTIDEDFTTTAGTNNGVGAIWEALESMKRGTNIFSIAFNAGTDGESVLRATASSPSNYYVVRKNDDIALALENAFSSIASKVSIAAKNGSVTDPMGELVNLIYSVNGPRITDDLAIYNAENADIYISQGSAIYDMTNEIINWDTGNVNEAEDAVMRYRISLEPDAIVDPGEEIYPNKTTTFSYSNYMNSHMEKDFKVPVITVKGDTIDVYYYVVNENGEPVNSLGVVVPLENAERLKENSNTNVYGTYPYTAEVFEGYVYYGYILNEGEQVKDLETVSITTTEPASNPELWFGYYLGKTSLKITKAGSEDPEQNFIFSVEGDGINLKVTIKGNGSLLIKDLPVGQYTVTEVTEWSWRYQPVEKSKTVITIPKTTREVVFENTRTSGKWLSGDSWLRNIFTAWMN